MTRGIRAPRTLSSIAVAAVAMCAVQTAALAQVSALPEAIQRRLADINPRYAADLRTYIPQTFELFATLLAASPKDGVTVTAEVAYGPDPKQRLDVYAPLRAAPDAPVVVFIHGGALTAGDKNANSQMYANVLYYAARHGAIGINANYRLAPLAAFPEGARDVGAVVAWVRRNAIRLGADPGRIVLVGHSSGGTHVATWAYDRSVHGPGGPGVAGVILVSARLRADNRKDDPNAAGVEAYFGRDDALYEARSPVTHAASSALPTAIVTAQYDNPFLALYGAELLVAMCASPAGCPRFVQVEGHNHISLVASVNTPDDTLGSLIRAFVAGHTMRSPY